MKLYLYLLTFLLVSCQAVNNEDKVNVVVKTNVKYLSLPNHFLEECKYPPPPKKETYLQKSYPEKERVLIDLYLEGVKEVGICNIRLKEAREYQLKMERLYREESDE